MSSTNRDTFRSNIMILACILSVFANAVSGNEIAFPADIDALVEDSQYGDFTLVVGDASGVIHHASKGKYDVDRRELIASASKLVTAVVIMDLVQSDILSLASRPGDFIDYWSDAKSPIADIELRHLLSFTSGLQKHKCTNRAFVRFEKCVKRIYGANSSQLAGTTYDYHGSHMHVAGLMAIKASGVANWAAVFDAFKEKHALFSNDDIYTNLRRRSMRNPMLAGGLHTTPRLYAEFLSALIGGKILHEESLRAIFSNHTHGLTFKRSPIQNGIQEHWDYGFGVWLECTQGDVEVSNCSTPLRFSSAGAFGFYPWIGPELSYFAIIGRKGRLTLSGERADVTGILNGREFHATIEAYFRQ